MGAQASPYTISTVAGSCTATACTSGYSGDGSKAIGAELNGPFGLAFDSSGNLFLSDTNNQRVRKISTSGTISTVAGNGTAGFAGDGKSATDSGTELNGPSGLTSDRHGNLFIADSDNFEVRKVAGGNISTVAGKNSLGAGFGGDLGPATSARLWNPSGAAVDSAGNIYIADPANNVVRVVCANQTPIACTTGAFGTTTFAAGDINTFAGNNASPAGYTGDGGPATGAILNNPVAVTMDTAGNLYIADTGNSVIRKVDTAGIITTVAGNGVAGYAGDGGQATHAELNTPKGVAVDPNGNLYIADSVNCAIRMVAPNGIITTIAGTGVPGFGGDGGAASSAQLFFPSGVAVNGGKVYVADNANNAIRLLTPVISGDFNGDGHPDLLWQSNSTRQVTVHYYGGTQGATYVGWNWLNNSGVSSGWVLVGAADFDGNGVPDLVWEYMPTGQVTVNYYGGPGGTTYLGWNWLNQRNATGWTVVAVADMDGNGVPDLIWQNNTTNQVTVNYYGGSDGAIYQGWNWLKNPGPPAGWRVVAAADFDGNGTPDLVWQYAVTRQVTVNYYAGTGGATYQGWNWLNNAGAPGWTVVGANDFDRNGVPDLVWQKDAAPQVTVNYYGGSKGATYIGWNWLNSAGASGWKALVPR